jgi:hypothetical protein
MASMVFERSLPDPRIVAASEEFENGVVNGGERQRLPHNKFSKCQSAIAKHG